MNNAASPQSSFPTDWTLITIARKISRCSTPDGLVKHELFGWRGQTEFKLLPEYSGSWKNNEDLFSRVQAGQPVEVKGKLECKSSDYGTKMSVKLLVSQMRFFRQPEPQHANHYEVVEIVDDENNHAVALPEQRSRRIGNFWINSVFVWRKRAMKNVRDRSFLSDHIFFLTFHTS